MASTTSTTPTCETSSSKDGENTTIFTTRNILIGGALLAAAVGAIVSLSYRKKPCPKSKSKKKNSKKKKVSFAKTPTSIRSEKEKTGNCAKPDAAPSKSAPPRETKSSKDDSCGKDAAKGNNSNDTAKDAGTASCDNTATTADAGTNPSSVDTPTVESVDESGIAASDLQTEGQVSNDTFEKFLEQSNALLGQPRMKDECAAIYKSGGNVGKFLQEKQGEIWKKLGVDPQWGVKQLALSIKTGQLRPGNNMTLQNSLVLEESLFSYAFHGSQEAVTQENHKIRALLIKAQQEMQRVSVEHANDRAALQKIMTELMVKFKKVNEKLKPHNVSDPMVTMELKANLSEEELMVLLKGQIIIVEHQKEMARRNQMF